MASGRTLLDISHEYEGPVGLCGGSGGGESVTNTVDYAYNARMATLSEEQQEWAREYFGVWKEFQKPYEIAQAKSNMAVLPQETGLYKGWLEAAAEILPADKALIMDGINQADGLIPGETRLAEAWMGQAERLLPLESLYYESQMRAAGDVIDEARELYEQSLENAAELMPEESGLYRKQLAAVGAVLPRESGVYGNYLDRADNLGAAEASLYGDQLENTREVMDGEKEFYKSGLETADRLLPGQAEAGERFLAAVRKGVDVNERMGLARADAAQAWKDAAGAALRANARLGVNPNSGRFQGVTAALATQEAEQIAGAVTRARVEGEQENFARMGQGASYNGAEAALRTALPVRPAPGNFNAGNAALQAGQAVRPQVNPANNAASEVMRGVRAIIGQAPRAGSGEILQGVNAIKG